jgi:hypothetical protein
MFNKDSRFLILSLPENSQDLSNKCCFVPKLDGWFTVLTIKKDN